MKADEFDLDIADMLLQQELDAIVIEAKGLAELWYDVLIQRRDRGFEGAAERLAIDRPDCPFVRYFTRDRR